MDFCDELKGGAIFSNVDEANIVRVTDLGTNVKVHHLMVIIDEDDLLYLLLQKKNAQNSWLGPPTKHIPRTFSIFYLNVKHFKLAKTFAQYQYSTHMIFSIEILDYSEYYKLKWPHKEYLYFIFDLNIKK